MLSLSRALNESEPDKAQKLRDTLDEAGKRRVKAQVEALVARMRSGQLGEVEQGQKALLGDLEGLLQVLTSELGDLDQRRAERQRLEALRREIRTAMEAQADLLSRTQELDRASAAEADGDPNQPAGPRRDAPDGAKPNKSKGEEGQPDSAASAEAQRRMRDLEQKQREMHRKIRELGRQMEPRSERQPETPGARPMGGAADKARDAADRLAQQQGQQAQGEQKAALENMQQAMDELEDALRQLRREEQEQTLAALEGRFRAMLEREKGVRAAVEKLDEKGPAGWSRLDQLALAEAADAQQQLTSECESTRAILVDEGTTVILPELMTQLTTDMRDVAGRLNRADTTPATQRVLDDIIAQLEEIMAAVSAERERSAEQREGGGEGGQGPQDQSLLPGSAEIKLVRSSQMRINARTGDLSAAPPARRDARWSEQMEQLGRRQRQLVDLTTRMNERK